MLRLVSLFSTEHRRKKRFEPNYSIDSNGNTPLHNVILACKNEDDIISFIANTGNDIAESMARTVNNNGKLPIDLILEKTVNQQTKNKMADLLIALIRINPLKIKKLSDYIDDTKIIQQYHCSPSSEMCHNIKIACAIANETRQAITASSSHPQINDAGNDEFIRLSNKLELERSCQEPTVFTILTHPIEFLFDTKHAVNKKIAQTALEHHLGNCYEFAIVARYLLKMRYRDVPAEIYEVSNGDHVFLVIGNGKNAVVCDGWAGEIYPMYDIERKLKCFRPYTIESSHLNVITSYNPEFHVIKPNTTLESYNISSKTLLIGLGILLTNILCALTIHLSPAFPKMSLR